VVLHVHIHDPRAATTFRGARSCVVATVGRNAKEGKWGVECSRKGPGKGDGTSLGYLGNSGMVVLYIKAAIRLYMGLG
jgi:hypothetical protein